MLLTGASGFLGRHLRVELERRGHEPIVAGRGPDADVRVDFSRDFDVDRWIAHLKGVDAVVNAVGIVRERNAQTFAALHTRAPQALFGACVIAGVKRVIQISALGADEGTTAYFQSKRLADEYLANTPVAWTIVQPSLVFGKDGASARLFTMLATLPIVPLPGSGEQRVQPIHVDDAVEALVRLIESQAFTSRKVALVGPRAYGFAELIREIAKALGRARPHTLHVPDALMRIGALIGLFVPSALLTPDTLKMLTAGNTASPDATTTLLGRPPRAPDRFIEPWDRAPVRSAAHLRWLLPLLRYSIAFLWIWTGLVSLFGFPAEESYALLERTGVPAWLAPIALVGASILDLALGLGVLFLRRRRWIWLSQIALILFYTVVISGRLPEFWLHPYGPIAKNLPVLAGILMLYYCEERSWNTRS